MKRLALLVAIDEHFGSDERLAFAETDCDRLYEALTSGRYGFGASNTLKLKGSCATLAQRAIRWNVLYGRLWELREAEPLELFVFYFAGDAFEADGETYLVPADGHPRHLDQCVRLAALLDAIGAVPAKQRLVIFETCRRSATGTAAAALPESFASKISRAEEMIVLSSCSVGECSHEDALLGGGVYTHYLAEALDNPAALANQAVGGVSVFAVHEYAAERTRRWAQRHGVSQNPRPYAPNAPTIRLGPGAPLTYSLPAYVADRESRTQRIVAILRNIEQPRGPDDRYAVRILARLSSFAIADNEPAHLDDSVFGGLLVEERDAMCELLERGAAFKVILSFCSAEELVREHPQEAQRYLGRMRHLAAFLRGLLRRPDVVARFTIVRFAMDERNLLLLDHDYVFEGRRLWPSGGFDVTTITEAPTQVAREVDLFDRLLTNGIQELRDRYPLPPGPGLNGALMKMTIDQLETEIEAMERTAAAERVH